MPSRKPRSSIKRHALGSHRTKSYRKRRTAARAAQRARPRTALKTTVGSAPNSYNFKRSYSYPLRVGDTDAANGVYLNADNTYMWYEMHTRFNKLPNHEKFKEVFNQYKITSVTHRMVPYFSTNLIPYDGPMGDQNSLVNYEMFIIPAAWNQRKHVFNTMTGPEIDDWLDSAQRKKQRLVPSKTITFTSMNPKIVAYKGPIDKDHGPSGTTMANPSWYSTDNAVLVPGGVDQTDVVHYTTQVLIRRVDGVNLAGAHRRMGYRAETDVFFKCRAVQ